ncbi:hypothetical protein [Hymenobacter bucti]|uniref:DUF2158 domain-containing protein n=1 Tax=Hymenobacter bucti TaxID=1844114 RepID=A0ABW4QWT6_9BACT
MESKFQLGDILELDGSHCVVVGLGGQSLSGEEVPEEHIAVWFGEIDNESSEGLTASPKPSRIEVRTIPEDYFKKGPEPLVSH